MTPTTLYVRGFECSDSGAGTPADPFCDIQAAADVVQPGQTVMVGYNDMFGIYDGDVHITRSGTPDQPITFEAAFPPGTAYDVFPDDGPATGNTATKPMPVAGRSGNPPMTGSVVAPKNGCVP